MSQPIILLHSPQMGENIGAAARVMLNFGCKNLRIVTPRDGWPNEKAIEMSAGAKQVIDNAEVFENLSDAIADLQTVYATTARTRDMNKPVITPKQIELVGKTGIVFGGERSGLGNAEVSLADKIISIPVNDEYSSLNLGQSVGIICYELFAGERALSSEIEPATKQEFESMIGHLDEQLSRKNFFQEPKKKVNMMLNIRNLFSRSTLSSQEVRTMRGIIRSLSERD